MAAVLRQGVFVAWFGGIASSARLVARDGRDARALRLLRGSGRCRRRWWRRERRGNGILSANAGPKLARRAAVGRGGRALRQRLRLPSARPELGRALQQFQSAQKVFAAASGSEFVGVD